MNLRTDTEKREYEILSPLASKAAESRGRVFSEEKCEYRTDYQRDRDRIVHSKAFRRLIHKTQVFIAPEDDHYRTRLTHTLEVSQVSRTVARILRYNNSYMPSVICPCRTRPAARWDWRVCRSRAYAFWPCGRESPEYHTPGRVFTQYSESPDCG